MRVGIETDIFADNKDYEKKFNRKTPPTSPELGVKERIVIGKGLTNHNLGSFGGKSNDFDVISVFSPVESSNNQFKSSTSHFGRQGQVEKQDNESSLEDEDEDYGVEVGTDDEDEEGMLPENGVLLDYKGNTSRFIIPPDSQCIVVLNSAEAPLRSFKSTR